MVRQIVCFGDSNTWGYDPLDGTRLPHQDRWTTVMAAQLGNTFHVIPEGLNGRTTVFEDPVEPGRNGLDHLVACLGTHHPVDAIVFMLGTNDTKYRFHLNASDIALGMKRLVKTVRAGDYGPDGNPVRIGIIAPAVVNEWVMDGPFLNAHPISVKLGAEYRALARELHCAFFDASEHVYCGMPDGIHLDAEQHRKLGLLLADWVQNDLFSD